jgi:hypothetical protein
MAADCPLELARLEAQLAAVRRLAGGCRDRRVAAPIQRWRC